MSSPARLKSEDIIVNAPLSFAGSAQRIMRLRRRATNPVPKAAVTAGAAVLVTFAWAFVVCWYLVSFVLLGIVTVPYRLLRRGSRKRKAEALRHRELLAAVATTAAVVDGS